MNNTEALLLALAIVILLGLISPASRPCHRYFVGSDHLLCPVIITRLEEKGGVAGGIP